MSAISSTLVPRRERGWRMGLANMLAKENFSWWRTRRWLVQALVAVLIMNGSLALNLKGIVGYNRVFMAAVNFMVVAALFVPVAAVSMAQDSILGERHSGTAAWVLSKPLRRTSFILSKLMAHGLSFFLIWVLLPCILAYYQIKSATGVGLSKSGYAGLIGLDYLNLLFYMTLALMLATLFNSRGPVLCISLFVAWAGPMQFINQPIEKYVPWLKNLLPWKLLIDFNTDQPLSIYLLMNKPLPTVLPIVATALWCVLFVCVAIWRFRREEF